MLLFYLVEWDYICCGYWRWSEGYVFDVDWVMLGCVGDVGICVGFFFWESYRVDGVWVVLYVWVDRFGVFCGSSVVFYVCVVGVDCEWWIYWCL